MGCRQKMQSGEVSCSAVTRRHFLPSTLHGLQYTVLYTVHGTQYTVHDIQYTVYRAGGEMLCICQTVAVTVAGALPAHCKDMSNKERRSFVKQEVVTQ